MLRAIFLCTTLNALPSLVEAGTFYPDADGYPVLSQNAVPCPTEWFDEYATCRTLVKEFGYYDNIQGLGFAAPKDTITDGASIPEFLIPVIGERYRKEFSRAATIHDWYVHRVGLNNGEYSYFKIQRMFYHALLDSNVDPFKAKAMYLAVLVGANKYTLRIDTPPQQCEVVEANCLRNYDDVLETKDKIGLPNSYQEEGVGGKIAASVQSTFFKEINPLDLEGIEEYAQRLRDELGLPDFDFIEVVGKE
ncbi:DUF1353 domain-containing protein [uncultured Tateyamaria sp.]|uniref:DUF1353 domain-containing protein n=1 Tax=uncultured Tateyamaria sp. TaxID=455651 RepID=UPI00263481B2|nr:DUF1353 domain-containing protein [uncultured Tateyamaria sp.]